MKSNLHSPIDLVVPLCGFCGPLDSLEGRNLWGNSYGKRRRVMRYGGRCLVPRFAPCLVFFDNDWSILGPSLRKVGDYPCRVHKLKSVQPFRGSTVCGYVYAYPVTGPLLRGTFFNFFSHDCLSRTC